MNKDIEEIIKEFEEAVKSNNRVKVEIMKDLYRDIVTSEDIKDNYDRYI